MPRVTHVKKARADVPNSDIKAGESYYWWKFRYGGKRVSRTPPKASQLTQSDYLVQLYDLQDRISSLAADDSLPSEVEDIASELRSLGEEQEEKRSNMPEQLQDSDSGSLLEERASSCSSAADELEGIDFDIDLDALADDDEQIAAIKDDKELTYEEKEKQSEDRRDEIEQEFWEEKLQEVQDVSLD